MQVNKLKEIQQQKFVKDLTLDLFAEMKNIIKMGSKEEEDGKSARGPLLRGIKQF